MTIISALSNITSAQSRQYFKDWIFVVTELYQTLLTKFNAIDLHVIGKTLFWSMNFIHVALCLFYY